MTFWDRFYMLCQIAGTTPNAVCKELGFSNATATKWKNGSTPKGDTLKKISNYFKVSTDYLLTGENPDGGIPIKVDSESINIQSIVDNAIKKYESEKEKLPQAPELLEQLTAVCADMSEDNQLKLIEIAKILKSQQVRKE